MNQAVSLILAWGAAVAGILMLGGAIFYFVTGSALPVDVHSLSGELRGLLAGNPLSVIELGIVVLLLTPIVSATAVGLHLIRQRDWRVAGAAIGILLILLLSYALH
jgi:uncharacterized membrane protein